ncbi:MAG: hypothetical protein ACFB3T_15620 [Geminicoccaceae bacterium]
MIATTPRPRLDYARISVLGLAKHGMPRDGDRHAVPMPGPHPLPRSR